MAPLFGPVPRGRILAFVLQLLLAAVLVADDSPPGKAGGDLVVALRAEPKTFNPAIALDHPSLTVLHRLHGDLARVDRRDQRPELALAESFESSDDGLEWHLKLRRGLRFSDGEPFDADDVVFTFRVLLDPAVGSPHRAFLMPGGEPIRVEKLDSHSLRFVLHRPYAAGLRLFDHLPILPRHRLAETYAAGGLAEAWGLAVAPQEVAGLGPFRLESYVPGERVVLVRNPHYFKVDAAGRRLPYLDRLVFVFVADQTAQALRFQAGEVHVVDRLSADSFDFLRRKQGRAVHDLGPGLEYSFLFFNLNRLDAGDEELLLRQSWFREPRFRRAVSLAVDREGIAGLVYSGRARPLATQVTPGIKHWIDPGLEPRRRSLQKARAELGQAGFTWDGRKRLLDPSGKPVEVTLITTSSNQARMATATVVQEDLRQIGVQVRLVGLEFRAFLERVFQSKDYDLALLSMDSGDTDPNALVPVLTSTGPNHLWRLETGGRLPAWQKEIDELMARQATALDAGERFRLYRRVQELMADHEPAVFLVSPHVLVAGAPDLGNFRPTVLGHSTLWNVDELYWQSSGRR